MVLEQLPIVYGTLLNTQVAAREYITTYLANNSSAIYPVANETASQAGPPPGFESIFAITGLLAVAYLVLGRRE